jgi:molecular chaperone GrpE
LTSESDTTGSTAAGELPVPESPVQMLVGQDAVAQAPEADVPPPRPAGDEPALGGTGDSEFAGPAPTDRLGEDGGQQVTDDVLAGISGSVGRLADACERYHDRAEQRESVIDHLIAEVDRLRRGDRRGVLRPLLAEICRLRNDLLRQADGLPSDFDAERARALLRSYADTVDLLLEDNGVRAFSPALMDAFDPRMHRRVGDEPAFDAAAVGCVASVRRDGYLDVEASSPIAPAEVVVFSRAAAPPRAEPGTPAHDAATMPDERNDND